MHTNSKGRITREIEKADLDSISRGVIYKAIGIQYRCVLFVKRKMYSYKKYKAVQLILLTAKANEKIHFIMDILIDSF